MTRAKEVFDECAVQDVPGWDPASLLRAESLPVDQILVPMPPGMNIEQSPDPIDRGNPRQEWEKGWDGRENA